MVTDYLGNELNIGDDVVVLSSGNSSWRKGTVTKIDVDSLDLHQKVQVEYNDHWYSNRHHCYLKNGEPIRFFTKPVRVSVSTYNIVKLLPEYLGNS